MGGDKKPTRSLILQRLDEELTPTVLGEHGHVIVTDKPADGWIHHARSSLERLTCGQEWNSAKVGRTWSRSWLLVDCPKCREKRPAYLRGAGEEEP